MVRARSILGAFLAAVALLVAQGAVGAATAAPPVYTGSAELLGTGSSGYFGNSVAADATGDTVVVGDPSQGAVYVFERPAGGWSGAPLRQVATIEDPAGNLNATKWGNILYPGGRWPEPADDFGLDVAISADGSTIVVSNPGPGTVRNRNQLWVYHKPAGGWTTGQKPFAIFDDTLSANLGCEAHNQLGAVMTLAPNGSWLAANATSCEGGSMYIDIFYLDGWQYEGSGFALYPAEVLDPHVARIHAMATDGSTLFVAPPGGTAQGLGMEAWNIDATVSVQGGQVTGPLFGCTPATLQPYFNVHLCAEPDAFLNPSGMTPADFSNEDGGYYSIAAGGGYVVFGLFNKNVAYVFKVPAGGFHGNVTGQTATLVPATAASGEDFGAVVAISSDGHEIAVGAPGATVDGHAGQGEVYVYREPRNGWQGGTSATVESQDFVASHGAAGDHLGINTIVGAIGLVVGDQTLAVGGGEVFASSPFKGTDEPVYAFSTEAPLSVALAGGGSGTVVGGSVDCGSTCSADVFRGQTVVLTATPGSGSTFSGWSGGGCSGTGKCSVTVSDATSVTATFAGTTTQTSPTAATVVEGSGYTGQLAVSGASSGLAFDETAGQTSDIVVQGSGAIEAAASLPPGTYHVAGSDEDTAGDSGAWTFTLTVEPKSGAPSAPTGLGAAAGNGEVTLGWTAPASPGGSAIEGYDVYVGSAEGAESTTPLNGSTPIATTSYTASGLTNGQTYDFIVRAVNASGTSAASNEASATPVDAPPGAPTDLTAAAGTNDATLTWSTPTSGGGGVTGYNIYEGRSAGAESTTPLNGATPVVGNSYIVGGLAGGSGYFFTVKAVNAAGTSAASNEASATPVASTGGGQQGCQQQQQQQQGCPP